MPRKVGANKKRASKRKADPSAPVDDVRASFEQDLVNAGLPADPDPNLNLTTDDSPSLLSAHAEGCEALIDFGIQYDQDANLAASLAEGPSQPMICHGSNQWMPLRDWLTGDERPHVVDPNGKVNVRLGQGTHHRVHPRDLATWILDPKAREGRKPRQHDLDLKPILPPDGVRYLLEQRPRHVYETTHYRVAFTRSTLDAFRGMEDDDMRRLWLEDSRMKLIPEVRKTLHAPVDESVRIMEREDLIKRIMIDDDAQAIVVDDVEDGDDE